MHILNKKHAFKGLFKRSQYRPKLLIQQCRIKIQNKVKLDRCWLQALRNENRH